MAHFLNDTDVLVVMSIIFSVCFIVGYTVEREKNGKDKE